MIAKIITSLTLSLFATMSFANFDNLTFNGFGSIVASQVLSGKNNESFEEYYLTQKNCPCFITDYNTGGLLNEDDGFSLKNESRIGLQLEISMTDDLSFTTQVVARAITNEFTLEWAYLTYNINDQWTFQAGRKRIPLYYFSTFQDVGIAYTWVRPPQALYGWEASNYNGFNLTYNNNIGEINISASIFTGNEKIDETPYNELYTDDMTIIEDSKWDNMIGFDFELSYEWLNARFIYQTSDNFSTNKFDGDYTFSGEAAEQKVMGLAINGEFDHWFFHIEQSENRREVSSENLLVKAPASMFALGIRVGKWTPFVSWSRYWEKSDSEIYQGEQERFITKSITLRYDVDSQNTIKVQLETFDDESKYDFVGDTTVLSFAYDFVF